MGEGTVRPRAGAPRFAVIGAGMAGILAAIKLRQAGFTDVTVFEKADRPGGTWRENTYPGITCDVPSHLYCYSFAPNPGWSHAYPPGQEIQDYFTGVADRYGVTPCTRLGDEVTSCEYADGRWHLATAAGHRDVVDVVIAATGVLHHPRHADLEGVGAFAGPCFHSARWNHDVKVEGARLGIVGTGSSAVQIMTAVVDRVEKVSLFQRTPQWIMPAENPAYSDEEKAAFRDDPQLIEDVRNDASVRFDLFSEAVTLPDSPVMRFIEQTARENLESSVKDPQLRERLRPDYRAGCKRLVVSPDFYRAIQEPAAELVTEAIRRIEPAGVRTVDGRLHNLDVLVLATGFRADAFVGPLSVTGRSGRTLAERWDGRPEAYLSISVPDFPNFFLVNGPNGPVGNFSLVEVAELQVSYIMALLERIRTGEHREVVARQSAMERFEAARVDAAATTVWASGCRSWYLDDRGVPAVWPWPFSRFRAEMAAPAWEAFEYR